MPVQKEIIWSDFNITFSNHPVSGDIARLTNEDAVKKSVKNLILTNKFERPFGNIIAGTNIRAYLFENFDPIVEEQLRQEIYEVITNFEPRAELINVVINSNADGNRIDFSIFFRVQNSLEPTSLDFYVERTR